jgi:hypothetical protein
VFTLQTHVALQSWEAMATGDNDVDDDWAVAAKDDKKDNNNNDDDDDVDDDDDDDDVDGGDGFGFDANAAGAFAEDDDDIVADVRVSQGGYGAPGETRRGGMSSKRIQVCIAKQAAVFSCLVLFFHHSDITTIDNTYRRF